MCSIYFLTGISFFIHLNLKNYLWLSFTIIAPNSEGVVTHQSVANIYCQSERFSALAVFAQLLSFSFSAPAGRIPIKLAE